MVVAAFMHSWNCCTTDLDAWLPLSVRWNYSFDIILTCQACCACLLFRVLWQSSAYCIGQVILTQLTFYCNILALIWHQCFNNENIFAHQSIQPSLPFCTFCKSFFYGSYRDSEQRQSHFTLTDIDIGLNVMRPSKNANIVCVAWGENVQQCNKCSIITENQTEFFTQQCFIRLCYWGEYCDYSNL